MTKHVQSGSKQSKPAAKRVAGAPKPLVSSAPSPGGAPPGVDGAALVRLDVSGAEQVFQGLLSALAKFAPSKEATAIWHGLLSDEVAREDGVAISSDKVLADVAADFAALVPALVEAPLPGYGPKRAYFALTIAVEHARTYRRFLEGAAHKASASKQKSGTVSGARKQRGFLRGLLSELAHGDDSLAAGIATATRTRSARTAEVAASIDGLTKVGEQLLADGASTPGMAEVLEDMAITHDVVRQAAEHGRSITAATSAHNAERTQLETESDALNAFDGRMWFELEALARAAERARDQGRMVPVAKLANTSRVRHRRPTAALGAHGAEVAHGSNGGGAPANG